MFFDLVNFGQSQAAINFKILVSCIPLLTLSARVLIMQLICCTFLSITLVRVQYIENHQTHLNAFCLRE